MHHGFSAFKLGHFHFTRSCPAVMWSKDSFRFSNTLYFGC